MGVTRKEVESAYIFNKVSWDTEERQLKWMLMFVTANEELSRGNAERMGMSTQCLGVKIKEAKVWLSEYVSPQVIH